jgi:hypothetical protein
VAEFSLKSYKQAKRKVWDDQNNRMTILFVLAALLVVSFTYNQYARRNYTISSATQRSYNHGLKNTLENINSLSLKLRTLYEFTGNMPINDDFEKKVRYAGIA